MQSDPKYTHVIVEKDVLVRDSLTSNYESMAGYLYKKSTSGNWQRRYFETNGTHLIYYKTHKMTKLLAAISLPQVGDISVIDDDGEAIENSGSHINSQNSNNNNNSQIGTIFKIDLKDRELQLRAASYEDAVKWVSVLSGLRDSKQDISTYPPSTLSAKPNHSDNNLFRAASGTIEKVNRNIFYFCCTPCCCTYDSVSSS